MLSRITLENKKNDEIFRIKLALRGVRQSQQVPEHLSLLSLPTNEAFFQNVVGRMDLLTYR